MNAPFAPSTLPSAFAANAAAPSAVDLARGRVMALSLGQLLDRARGARDVLPHLAALESALRMQGLAVMDQASVPALRKMCSQLASLPVAQDDAPLLDLQSRLLAALERRDRASKPKFISSVISEDKLEVAEISHSDFMAIAEAQGMAPATPR